MQHSAQCCSWPALLCTEGCSNKVSVTFVSLSRLSSLAAQRVPLCTQTHLVLRSSKRPKEWSNGLWFLTESLQAENPQISVIMEADFFFCLSLNTSRSVSTKMLKHSLAWSHLYHEIAQCCCKMKKLCAQTSPKRLGFFSEACWIYIKMTDLWTFPEFALLLKKIKHCALAELTDIFQKFVQ